MIYDITRQPPDESRERGMFSVSPVKQASDPRIDAERLALRHPAGIEYELVEVDADERVPWTASMTKCTAPPAAAPNKRERHGPRWTDAIDVHHHVVPAFYRAAVTDAGRVSPIRGVAYPHWHVEASLDELESGGVLCRSQYSVWALAVASG